MQEVNDPGYADRLPGEQKAKVDACYERAIEWLSGKDATPGEVSRQLIREFGTDTVADTLTLVWSRSKKVPASIWLSDDEKAKSENALYFALTHDQCGFGFEHTKERIGLWLAQCDRAGRKSLLTHITELDHELDVLGR